MLADVLEQLAAAMRNLLRGYVPVAVGGVVDPSEYVAPCLLRTASRVTPSCSAMSASERPDNAARSTRRSEAAKK